MSIQWLPEQLDILRDKRLTVEDKYDQMGEFGYGVIDIKNTLKENGWKSKNSPHLKKKKLKKKKKNPYIMMTLPDGTEIPRYRLVVRLVIGGLIPDGLGVHHINRNKKDDRPDNLYLCHWREHKGFHRMEEIPQLKSNLSNYIYKYYECKEHSPMKI